MRKLLLLIASIAAAADGPQFTPDGQLVRPDDYREWVYLSSGLGMSYGAAPTEHADHPPVFDNVFVNRPAYKSFLQTGKWPDKTMFVLEIRSSGSKASINKDGRFQTERVGLSAEVKDEARFPGKWAFFGFGHGESAGKMIPATGACYSCHKQNGAVDNTFVQFYPTLVNVAKEKGTLKTTE
jgi:Cytochrome P460